MTFPEETKMIKNIVFDIGQVLVDFRWRAYMEEDLKFPPEVVEQIAEKIVLTRMWDDLDLGIRDEAEVIEEMKSTLPALRKETDIFFDGIVNLTATRPYSTPWIKELKEKGYKVYLLSNYPKSYFEIHERTHFDFTKYVDGKVISGFEKLAKPDPAIYRLLFERYGLIPEECVFLDDRAENISAAAKLGMNTILFISYENAKAALDALLA
jgi:putative hydrolase of the HAD superfamily